MEIITEGIIYNFIPHSAKILRFKVEDNHIDVVYLFNGKAYNTKINLEFR